MLLAMPIPADAIEYAFQRGYSPAHTAKELELPFRYVERAFRVLRERYDAILEREDGRYAEVSAGAVNSELRSGLTHQNLPQRGKLTNAPLESYSDFTVQAYFADEPNKSLTGGAHRGVTAE